MALAIVKKMGCLYAYHNNLIATDIWHYSKMNRKQCRPQTLEQTFLGNSLYHALKFLVKKYNL